MLSLIKNKNTQFLGLLVLLVGVVALFSARVNAAPAGCYTFNTNGGAYSTTPCNDIELTRAVNQSGKCFVRTITPGGTTTAFSDRPCANITLPAASTPPISPGGGGGTGGGTIEDSPIELPSQEGKDQCGKGSKQVEVGFNIGCRGDEYPSNQLNPIVDMAFAIFRVLAAGVGLVVTGSIIVAGIQYSASRGNPQATQAAIARVTNSIVALLIYVFMFTIANFLVPGGMFI